MANEIAMPGTRRGGIVVERAVRFASDGVVMLRQRFVGDDRRVIVTHDGSLRSLVEVRSGAIVFEVAERRIVAPPRFVLAVPPRSVLPMRFCAAEVVSDGAGVPRALDDHDVPVLEEAGRDPRERGEVLHVLDADAGAPGVVVRARAALHELLDQLAPVRGAARRVGVAPETLSRAFAAAYGIAPKQYCHRARLFDAALRLLGGASVMEAALRVGFNDLSRFYVQFRAMLGSTPGRYARIRKRQDGAAAPGAR